MNSQLTHNKTYAYRLPPTLIETARSLADFHENGVFSDKESGGVGNSTFASVSPLLFRPSCTPSSTSFSFTTILYFRALPFLLPFFPLL